LAHITYEIFTDRFRKTGSMCRIACKRIVSFRSTGFSLCGFDVDVDANKKEHRLKPVLLESGQMCGNIQFLAQKKCPAPRPSRMDEGQGAACLR
jgi:hypothetical protein